MAELLAKMGQAGMANAYHERATQIRANSGAPGPQRQGARAPHAMVS
jgi:hypothetical protein